MTEQQLRRELGISIFTNESVRDSDKIKYYPICKLCGIYPKEPYSDFCFICNENKDQDY